MQNPLPPACARRYVHIKQLATGGFGAVHLARQQDLDRLVVVKLLHAEVLSDPEQVGRFENEARITAALESPHIVKLIEAGFDGVPWIVYEYLPGKSVRALLHDGALPVKLGLTIALHTLAGLSAAHERGILHRDIKPENVLGGEGLEVFKVTDFGIAKWTGEGAVKTRTGFVLGTPAYLAPELITGTAPSAQADVYATGVMLHELLAGAPPFVDENPVLLMERHLKSAPPPLPARVLEVEPELARIVARALAKTPEERFPTAAEMHEALRRLRTASTPASPLEVQAAAPRAWGAGGQSTAAVSATGIKRALEGSGAGLKRSGATRAVSRIEQVAPGWSTSGKWARRTRVALVMAALFVGVGLLSAAWQRRPPPEQPVTTSLTERLGALEARTTHFDQWARIEFRKVSETKLRGEARRDAYTPALRAELARLVADATRDAPAAVAHEDRTGVRLPFAAVLSTLGWHTAVLEMEFPPAKAAWAQGWPSQLLALSRADAREGEYPSAEICVELRRTLSEGVTLLSEQRPQVQRLLEVVLNAELRTNADEYWKITGLSVGRARYADARECIELLLLLFENRERHFRDELPGLRRGTFPFARACFVPGGLRDFLEHDHGGSRALPARLGKGERPTDPQRLEFGRRLTALREMYRSVQLERSRQDDVDAVKSLGEGLLGWLELPTPPEATVPDPPAPASTRWLTHYLRAVVLRPRVDREQLRANAQAAVELEMAWTDEHRADRGFGLPEALRTMAATLDLFSVGHSLPRLSELMLNDHPGHAKCCQLLERVSVFAARPDNAPEAKVLRDAVEKCRERLHCK